MQPLHPRPCSPRSQRLQPSQRGRSSRGRLLQQTADRLPLQPRLLQRPTRCTTPRCTIRATATRPSRPLQASPGAGWPALHPGVACSQCPAAAKPARVLHGLPRASHAACLLARNIQPMQAQAIHLPVADPEPASEVLLHQKVCFTPHASTCRALCCWCAGPGPVNQDPAACV